MQWDKSLSLLFARYFSIKFVIGVFPLCLFCCECFLFVLTALLQILSCLSNPSLMDKGIYADDVVDHAKTILGDCGGHSAGAYRLIYPFCTFWILLLH